METSLAYLSITQKKQEEYQAREVLIKILLSKISLLPLLHLLRIAIVLLNRISFLKIKYLILINKKKNQSKILKCQVLR